MFDGNCFCCIRILHAFCWSGASGRHGNHGKGHALHGRKNSFDKVVVGADGSRKRNFHFGNKVDSLPSSGVPENSAARTGLSLHRTVWMPPGEGRAQLDVENTSSKVLAAC